MIYPEFKKGDYTEEYFGIKLPDPYRGIHDPKNPDVLAWVADENAYTDRWFDKTELDNKIAQLRKEAVLPEYQYVSPWKDGYSATHPEEGDWKIWRLNNNFEKVEIVMDKSSIEGYSPLTMLPCPCDDRYYLIVGSYDGDMIASPKLFDWETGTELAAFHDFYWPVWSAKAPVFYYPLAVLSEEPGVSAVQFRKYDVLAGNDELILEADGVIGEPHISHDGTSIIFEIWKDYTVSYFFSYDEETESVTDITNGKAVQMKYADTLNGRHIFIKKEDAERGELVSIEKGSGIENGEAILPESDITLDKAFVVDDKLFVLATENASFGLYRIDDGGVVKIDLSGSVYTLGLNGREKSRVFLKYESFTEAASLIAFDGSNFETVYEGRETEYPDVVTEQFRAASSADGTEIPYFVVHRKDIVLDGSNPTYLYAYGGYNTAMYPWAFDMVTNLNIAEWANRGGIYVLANIRGGNEFGTSWHEQGMLTNKRNCYADFISVAEKLIEDGWTSTPKLTIDGCSNGGLLMSAVMTMRPELFGCVIDSVPHTDMIHFVEDDRGPMYITEYGNPIESKEMFEYFLSYSPYHNVREEKYPPTYIQTGECDNNVPPYHGKKFAAKMQEMNKSENPILLRVLAKGAHDRGTGEEYWKTISEMQLFAEKAMGI